MNKKALKILFFISLFSLIFVLLISQSKKTLNNQNENEWNESDVLINFFKIHNRMLAVNNHLVKRVTLNQCFSGYGNRLNSFVSSLLIAILTDSQLMVKWPEVEQFVQLPIRVFTDENIQSMVINDKQSSIYKIRPRQSWLKTKNISQLMTTNIPSFYSKYAFTGNECGAAFFMELCSNPVYLSKLFYFKLLSQESFKSVLEVLFEGDELDENEKQERLFQVGFEVGGNLLNRVWLPNKQINQAKETYLNETFKSHIVIGIQLRYLYLDGNEEEDVSKFIECAKQIEMDYFLLRNKSLNTNSFKWFLTGDSQVKLNKLLQMYPSKTFSTNKYHLGHIDEDKHGYFRSILDIELLSQCDELILTGGSTYGWIAAMKMLKLPFYVNGKTSSMTKCLRHNLSQPSTTNYGQKTNAIF